jgi:hypothetical protein
MMGQDFDACRADHAARWGAESGAASAPAPAHNRVSLSPGPGLPAAGGPGFYNDCASAGMADGSVDNNTVPPSLPPPQMPPAMLRLSSHLMAVAVAAWRRRSGGGGIMVAVTAVWQRWWWQLGCGSLAARHGDGVSLAAAAWQHRQRGGGGSSGVGGSVVAVTAVWRRRRLQRGGGAATLPGWRRCDRSGSLAAVVKAAWW